MQRRSLADTGSAAAELVVALVLGSRAAERDLLLLLIGGSTPAEAAARLGINAAALAERLRRVRRHAERLSESVGSSATLDP